MIGSFEVGDRVIEPPVEIRDGDQWSAQLLAALPAVRALVAPAGLEPIGSRPVAPRR